MKTGDLVEIKTKKEKLQGIVMPSKSNTTLKLKSGYNLSIKKNRYNIN